MILVKCTDLDRAALAGIQVDPQEMKDDGFDWLNVRVKKPWGHEVERYRDQQCSIWWLNIYQNMETSMHCHPAKTTLLVMIDGLAMLSTLSMQKGLNKGDVVVIEPGAFHRTTAVHGNVLMYEIESPPNKRNLVRLADSYGRGQGYERVCENSPS